MPWFAANFLKEIVIDVHKYKPITPNLVNKNLIPIIFSHGLTASRGLYTTHCRELASCGYIVFALDHHDGSCHFTLDEDGVSVPFDRSPQGKGTDKDPEVMTGKI